MSPLESGERPLSGRSRIALQPGSARYARSAADDKALIIAIVTAVDAIRAAGLTMRSNVKFAFEGKSRLRQPGEDPRRKQETCSRATSG